MRISRRKTIAVCGGAISSVALWWRRHPSACPYGQRFWLLPPHPLITRSRLRAVLDPRPAERMLEIGPGTGYYTLPASGWVTPAGQVDIFDLQQQMLDHTMRRAHRAGLVNVIPAQGDARELPYADASFDAVYLVT